MARYEPNERLIRENLKKLGDILESKKSDIEKILPAGHNADVAIKGVLLACQDNPYMMEKCTTSSIYLSALQAFSLGLNLHPKRADAFLTARRNTCTLMASRKGWTKLALQTPGVDMIRCSVVYENDEFYCSEHPPEVRHIPERDRRRRGEVIGAVAVAYAIRNDKYHIYDFAFMDDHDLELARKSAEQNKASSPWEQWTDEMRKNSATKRLCKWLPGNDRIERLSGIESEENEDLLDLPDTDVIEQIEQEDKSEYKVSDVEENNKELVSNPSASTRTSALKMIVEDDDIDYGDEE